MQKIEDFEVEEKQAFEINDMGSLTWVMREVLAPLKAKVEQAKELEKAEIERIKLWAENETRSPLQEIEYWEQRIADFHLELLRNDPKQKTLSTPYGKSTSRTSKAQPEMTDEQLLLNYAKNSGFDDLINVKETVKWGDLKKTLKVVGNNVVDANGEIMEGVKVKPETVTTKVELT